MSDLDFATRIELKKKFKPGKTLKNDDSSESESDTDKKVRKEIPKRADKNAPAEVSSKKQVSRTRKVVDLPAENKKILDPRFNPLCGHFNQSLYETSYGFIKDIQATEIQQVRKQITLEKDDNNREKLEKLLKQMTSRMEHEKKSEKKREIKRKWKKQEEEMVKQGKTPYFLKKSDVKKLELVDKFNSMKTKDVNKFIEKKRKRNAAKERLAMPKKRHVEE